MFSPQAEVRFLLPAFGLMFALCPIVAIGAWSIRAVSAIAAVIAITTSFSTGQRRTKSHYFAACGRRTGNDRRFDSMG